jgi:hypothetical protein
MVIFPQVSFKSVFFAVAGLPFEAAVAGVFTRNGATKQLPIPPVHSPRHF